MQLSKIERVDAKSFEGFLRVLTHRSPCKILRPTRLTASSKFGGYKNIVRIVAVVGEELTDDRLAPTRSINIGRVEDVDPAGHGRLQRGNRILL